MDMERGLKAATGAENCEALSTTGLRGSFWGFFGKVFTILHIFTPDSESQPSPTQQSPLPESRFGENNSADDELVGGGKPPWSAGQKTKPVEKDQASTSASSSSISSPVRAEEQVQSTNHSNDEGSTMSAAVLPPQPLLSHPIVVNLRKQELGKTILGVAVSAAAGLIAYMFTQKSPPVIVRFTVVALSIGCTAIWNGILLRETCPLISNAAEQIGIIIVLLAFHGLVGSFLPPKLLWIPGFLGILTIIPFVLSCFHQTSNHTSP